VTRPAAIAAAAAALVAACLVGGCCPSAPPRADIRHYLRSPESVARLHRVAFVSLYDEEGTAQIAHGMTEALAADIRAKGLFHLDIVSNDDVTCRDLPLLNRQAFTMRDLALIRDALNCEAVMFGSVNHFRPYPRMELGVYVRLIDLKNGNLAWGVDHTWDTQDRQTRQRMAHYFACQTAEGQSPSQYDLSLMSARVFEEFIASEAAGTLPTAVRAEDQGKGDQTK
jgi:hypothetical protein